MNTTEIVLIDLSSIAYPIYLVSQSEPDPNRASQQIVARVRTIASQHAHCAICIDTGRSFRRDVSAEYKANRPEREEALHHQIKLAIEQLASDGFPVWGVKGFEADDVIATAATRAVSTPDLTVLIVTADKDLLQLVTDRVRVMNARDGSLVDPETVGVKFGVTPSQVRDFLTLVGDASDNIKGAKGIGAKKAAELLTKFGSLDAVYRDLKDVGAGGMGLQPAVATSLRDFEPRFETTRKLVTLRSDLDIPFEEIASDRTPKTTVGFGVAASDFGLDTESDAEEPISEDVDSDEPSAPGDVSGPQLVVQPPASQAPAVHVPRAVAPTEQGLVVRKADDVLPAPSQWERQLEPRSMSEVRVIARDMYDSRMFSDYGTPQAVMSTLMLGRELGLPTMASLRLIHIIEGKQGMSAQLMVALVLKSGFAEYFEPVSFDDQQATFETHRKGARRPVTLTHTIEMAKTAQLVKPNSNWLKIPTDMCVARAQSRLCRMVYADVVGGLYTPDELAEIAAARTEQVA